jgi:hypothetical protein
MWRLPAIHTEKAVFRRAFRLRRNTKRDGRVGASGSCGRKDQHFADGSAFVACSHRDRARSATSSHDYIGPYGRRFGATPSKLRVRPINGLRDSGGARTSAIIKGRTIEIV